MSYQLAPAYRQAGASLFLPASLFGMVEGNQSKNHLPYVQEQKISFNLLFLQATFIRLKHFIDFSYFLSMASGVSFSQPYQNCVIFRNFDTPAPT